MKGLLGSALVPIPAGEERKGVPWGCLGCLHGQPSDLRRLFVHHLPAEDPVLAELSATCKVSALGKPHAQMPLTPRQGVAAAQDSQHLAGLGKEAMAPLPSWFPARWLELSLQDKPFTAPEMAPAAPQG